MPADRIVDRENELGELNALLSGRTARMIGVTGRRRLGKTTLLESWARNSGKPVLFWPALKRPSSLLLQEFSQAVYQHEHQRPAPSPLFTYPSWREVFEDLARICSGDTRHILIIDEFPYAVTSEPSLPSVLQNAWDHYLKHSNLVLVLCGSQIGMMNDLYTSDAPLFRRLAGPMRLQPIPFAYIQDFMPGYDFDSRTIAYACFGGVPAYLETIDPRLSILENIQQQVFSDFGVFANEPEFLISDQVSDASYYNAILEAVAQGARLSGEIATRAGFTARSNPIFYLKRLCEMNYLADAFSLEIPPQARKKSRKTHYLITDPMLQFYFRFVQKYRGALNLGLRGAFSERLKEQIASFTGKNAFEVICQQWLAEQARQGQISFAIEDIGQIWGDDGEDGTQVDVAAISWRDKCILVGEAKWTETNIDQAVVRKLLEKTIPIVRALLPERGAGWRVLPYLFARRGFAREAFKLAAEAGVQMVAVSPIEDRLEVLQP